MKKFTLIFVFCLVGLSSFSQKKKSVKKPATTTSILAKSENLTAEIVKSSFYLFSGTATKKDTI